MSGTAEPLLSVEHLVKDYGDDSGLFSSRSTIRAVNDVTFSISRGEAVGLVGESGSGKTTLGRCILRLIEPTSGKVVFDGNDVLALQSKALRRLRLRMQIVFQDPYGSLNPRMTVGYAVGEPMIAHRLESNKGAHDRTRKLFEEVGLDATLVDKYPHELSGGQRQRVGIARALSVEPEFLILDEPVSALDVSVQAQVLNLLATLHDERELTYLLIAHDLAVVRHVASRVAVMYLGKIVEIAHTNELYEIPFHPYTVALLSSVPIPNPEVSTNRIVLSGDIPSPSAPPSGCAFNPRCPHELKGERCQRETPDLRELQPGRFVACHFGDRPMPLPSV